MTGTCDACRKSADTKKSIRCTKCTCIFHLLCVSLSAVELTAETKANWSCPNCRNKIRKGDNTNTPARPSIPTTPGWDTNITQRNSKKPLSHSPEESTSEASLILTEIRMLRGDMNDLKQEFRDAQESNSKRMDDFEFKLNDLKQEFKDLRSTNKQRMDEFELSLYASVHRISSLEEAPQVTQLEERIMKLEEMIQHQAQHSLRNEMEVVGIPETPNENLTHTILVAASTVGAELTEGDIDWVERVGPKPTFNSSPTESQRSRVVVVRFVKRDKRVSFLKAARARRNITSSDLGVAGPARNIYFNERLTKTSRQLFQEARRRAKACGFQHCWLRNGNILIRKEQGRPAISIRNQVDLDQHLRERDAPAPQGGKAPPAGTTGAPRD